MSVFERFKAFWGVSDGGPRRGHAPGDVERRDAARYEAVEHLGVRLCWAEDGVDHETRGEFLNVASQGALLAVEEAPSADGLARLRLDGPEQGDWVDVKIVRVDSPNQVGCTFPAGCPYDMFKQARGFRSENRPAGVSTEFNGRDWH